MGILLQSLLGATGVGWGLTHTHMGPPGGGFVNLEFVITQSRVITHGWGQRCRPNTGRVSVGLWKSVKMLQVSPPFRDHSRPSQGRSARPSVLELLLLHLVGTTARGRGPPRPAGMATPAWLWEEGPAAAHSGVLLEELLRPPPPSLCGEAGTTRTPVQPSSPRQHLLQLWPPGIPTLSLWGLVETSDAWYPQCHFSWRPRCGSGWGTGMDLGVAARVKVPGLGAGDPRAVQVASLSSPGKMNCSWLCPAHPWNSFSNLDLPGAGEAGLEHHPLMGCLFARSEELEQGRPGFLTCPGGHLLTPVLCPGGLTCHLKVASNSRTGGREP